MRLGLLAGLVLALIAPGSAAAELAIGSRSAEEEWIVTVSVETTGLGPVEVAAGSFRPAAGWGRQWLEHELVLTNTGERPVTFADTWRAGVLGPRHRPMLVADAQGLCGFKAVEPLRGACLLPLVFVDMRPGRSVTRTVTLWKGLRRMEPLDLGTYVFHQPLRYRLARHPPAEGTGRRGTIELVYRVEAGA